MHYHAEIIMPPTDDVEGEVENILAQFSDHKNEENEGYTDHSFWEWYQLGGRYSGSKIEARLGADRVKAFHEELQRRKVTVSGLIFGKQELLPASQIPEVDALWREWFPDGGDVCPLFKHSGDSMAGDVCTFAEMPEHLTAFRVIFAAPGWSEPKFRAQEMFTQEIWNGCTHEKTVWDGSMLEALRLHQKRLEHMTDEAREKYTPKDDWLVVTVDYHS